MRGSIRSSTVAIAVALGVGYVAIPVSGAGSNRPVFAPQSGPGAVSEQPSAVGELVDAVSATAAPTAAAGGGGDSVIDGSGKVTPAGYRAMAAKLATDAGIEYRFGPSAAAAGVSAGSRPTAWKPSDKALDVHGNGPARTYQVAGPQAGHLNDYSSNQGQLAYVPGKGGSSLGVDHVATLEMGENTFAYQPRLTWTYYGGGHPEVEFTKGWDGYKCVQRIGSRYGRTVAQARAYAHGEAMASSFVAFDNGLIAPAGHNTAQSGQCIQLPKGLRPSAISVTNGNEFVLVTVWDPATLSSKLAVIAVGGARPKGEFWNFEWNELYPGIPNYGHPTFLKLLGLIDLPVAAPTGLSAVSNAPFGTQLVNPGHQGNSQRGEFTLSEEANRQTFVNGPNRPLRPTAGYAVVTSKSERKAVFVDLQPLFSQVTSKYFGNRSTFDSVRSKIGKQASQFPYAFSADPAGKPVVVKTVSTGKAPTAVAAAVNGAGNPRAYIATADGRLHVYRTGGLATASAARASDVKRVGAVKVGRNPTNITYIKDKAIDPQGRKSLPDTLLNTLIVTSRVDREVQWVELSGDSGSVRRTLRDSRLVDPIAAEDNNNHGTQSYVISIADYGAGRLFNYRYGPIIFTTNGGARYGMGPSGDAAFEFGGAYNPRGRPFSISVTNVT